MVSAQIRLMTELGRGKQYTGTSPTLDALAVLRSLQYHF